MLNEIGKLFEPLAHKQKPTMGLSDNSFEEEKAGENYSDQSAKLIFGAV